MTIFEQIEYPFSDVPPAGEVLLIQPGVLWARMPLPMALDHINVYLLEDRDGWWIVDTGIRDEFTREAWEKIFDGVLDGRPVIGLICTHMHPDHIGLAGWLSERWRAPLWMTQTEFMMARIWSVGITLGPNWETMEFYRRVGMPQSFLDQIKKKPSGPNGMIELLPASYRRVSEGDTFRIGACDWQAVIGQGHSPEHLCLCCEERGLLISGDQVLPTISSNVSVMGIEPEANPLFLWLASHERFLDLPEKTLVLPAHGLPFYGLRPRLRALIRHHESHLELIEEACAKACRVRELLPLMFRRELDEMQLGMAIGECLAHLHLLMSRGRIERTLDQEGLYTYRTTHPEQIHHVDVEEGLDDGLLMDFEGGPL